MKDMEYYVVVKGKHYEGTCNVSNHDHDVKISHSFGIHSYNDVVIDDVEITSCSLVDSDEGVEVDDDISEAVVEYAYNILNNLPTPRRKKNGK